MENLLKYVRTVHGQIGALLNPTKPDPTEEQLHSYTAKVIASLNGMTANAPQTVKEKIEKAFSNHWNVKENAVGPDGITALELQASFKFLVDELTKMAPKVAAAPKAPANKKTFTGETVTETKTLAEEKLVGRIVGPQGRVLKEIQAASDCTLNIAGPLISITGPKDGVEVAMKAIDEILQKGFSVHTAGEDFAEAVVKVHRNRIADIIGKEGANIIAIKTQCEVEIGVTDSGAQDKGKGKGSQKKAQVVIGGPKKGVEKAKEVLAALMSVYHHPITHPGKVHEEIEVQPYHYNLLIGKKGSEIKHMQNSFHVRVYIPNETTTHEGVIVVGEQRDVDTCKKHIENLVWKAENRPGRDNYGADGGYDDEEPEEDWMGQYLYKRT